MNELFMPAVDRLSEAELQDVFSRARQAVAQGTPEKPSLAIITPGRAITTLGGFPRSKLNLEETIELNYVVGSNKPQKVTVIAFNDILNVNPATPKGGLFSGLRRNKPELNLHDAARKNIRFLGMLLALSGLGHNIVIFEGHPSALAAGCADADVIIIDERMLAHLPQDWYAVITRAMENGLIVIINRDGSPRRCGRVGMPAPSTDELNVPIRTHEDFPGLVKQAREQSGRHQVTVISADRHLLGLSLNADAQLPPQMAAQLSHFIGTTDPQALTVITPMNIQAEEVKLDQLDAQQLTAWLAQSAPFLAYVAPNFAVLGHSVIAFEGNPADLAEGCAGANVVLIDEYMGQRLLPDWTEQVRSKMKAPKRVLIYHKNGDVEMLN